ncbi:hypothetical protein HPB50_006927 [Hyalomma asiaticum]|uniref:Uncharacterized protein n=1 Tax=Hyalomma asiaticum TaxID=266040 RepID=A0ACB7RN00_HYAAI|nr:hypothetical protein HPB50_006927 [Hyalomma asiaticum]
MSDGSSGSTAMTQPDIVATRSTTAKLRAARHANNLGNTSMSQSAAAAVATSEPASSTAIQPPCANSSASTMKPAMHADAAASGSAFPAKAAEGAPSFPRPLFFVAQLCAVPHSPLLPLLPQFVNLLQPRPHHHQAPTPLL